MFTYTAVEYNFHLYTKLNLKKKFDIVEYIMIFYNCRLEMEKNMGDYFVDVIRPSDKTKLKKREDLLKKEGLKSDKNLDLCIGLFDENYRLAATGSCYKNTLRCIAVDSDLQGEGLLNLLITYLTDFQFSRGNKDLFLYTKCSTAKFFSDLNFYEITRVDNRLVFMENKKNGFLSYLKHLQQETSLLSIEEKRPSSTAIVMNANPFTLGHQYLTEKAAAEHDLVHLFIVSEDSSLVPFSVRYRLVKEGTKHLKNIVYHTTQHYMISNATFPSYFIKDEDEVVRSHARLDLAIFLKIAETLNISSRYVGEEPFSHITNLYNEIMYSELSANNITCNIIPRKENVFSAISASSVRALIAKEDFETVKAYLPSTTYDYFCSAKSEQVRQNIKKTTL